MLSSDNKAAFLNLVRLGIGHQCNAMPNLTDWGSIESIAEKQGLSAVVIDGIERLPVEMRPPKMMLLQWIGESLQGYEYRYEQYLKAISGLAAFYNQHGLKMMLLKGYACSLDWPRPDHRPCGDIDIWQFGKQKEADELLSQVKGITIDKSHLHHTVFDWRDFMVENHYEIVDTLSSRSNAKIESLLKQLAMNDKNTVEVYGEKVWIPSPDFHALFLLRHAILHFTVDEMNVRHALDWGFFVKMNGSKVNWDWFLAILDKFKMLDFFNTLNAICMDNLGFGSEVFPYTPEVEQEVKERVLEDLLTAPKLYEEPKGILKRIVFKYRRLKERTWKHELCYRESMCSHLLSSLWLHITHPDII